MGGTKVDSCRQIFTSVVVLGGSNRRQRLGGDLDDLLRNHDDTVAKLPGGFAPGLHGAEALELEDGGICTLSPRHTHTSPPFSAQDEQIACAVKRYRHLPLGLCG